MKKDKRELGKLRLLVSITLASICVRDLKRDLECRVRCTKRIYIKAQAQPAFMVVHLLTFGKRGGPVMIVMCYAICMTRPRHYSTLHAF